MKKICYYSDYDEDLIKSNNQNYKLSSDYVWIHDNKFYKFISNILYKLAKFIGGIYCKFFLKVEIENSSILEKYKNTGYFIYGNHTQPIGDVFIPAMICKNKRIYTLASPANFGIPIIGRLLPMLGIIPTPENISQTKKMYNTVKQRIDENNAIIIYPEAHVWEYFTKIRPFSDTSFKFPVEYEKPIFCITTTYYKKKNHKRPRIKVYVDGPFIIDKNLSKKENQINLKKQIYNCMQERSKKSTYEYIEYKQIKKEK